jgi:hypothetical protein
LLFYNLFGSNKAGSDLCKKVFPVLKLGNKKIICQEPSLKSTAIKFGLKIRPNPAIFEMP